MFGAAALRGSGFGRAPQGDADTFSISVAIPGGGKHRADDDLQVEPERPVVDVEKVVFDALAHFVVLIDLAAVAVDLRPSGDARFDVVTPRVERDAALELVIVRQRM